MQGWDTVYSTLLTVLPTLAGYANVPVYDGAPLTNDETDAYVAVGFVLDEDGAGSFRVEPNSDGFHDTESGEVRCEVYGGNGDGDLAAARAASLALVAPLREYLKTDRTLGLPVGSSTSLSVDVLPQQSSSGAGQLLVMSVSYVVPFI
ncbi:MAG: hypothetical protein ACXVGE_22430 [Blastococcus sp.]